MRCPSRTPLGIFTVYVWTLPEAPRRKEICRVEPVQGLFERDKDIGLDILTLDRHLAKIPPQIHDRPGVWTQTAARKSR